jgi:hypothetical protein
MFIYHFLYENVIVLKKINVIRKITRTFYLSNEPNCSPAQSGETIPLNGGVGGGGHKRAGIPDADMQH